MNRKDLVGGSPAIRKESATPDTPVQGVANCSTSSSPRVVTRKELLGDLTRQHFGTASKASANIVLGNTLVVLYLVYKGCKLGGDTK